MLARRTALTPPTTVSPSPANDNRARPDVGTSRRLGIVHETTWYAAARSERDFATCTTCGGATRYTTRPREPECDTCGGLGSVCIPKPDGRERSTLEPLGRQWLVERKIAGGAWLRVIVDGGPRPVFYIPSVVDGMKPKERLRGVAERGGRAGCAGLARWMRDRLGIAFASTIAEVEDADRFAVAPRNGTRPIGRPRSADAEMLSVISRVTSTTRTNVLRAVYEHLVDTPEDIERFVQREARRMAQQQLDHSIAR